MSKKVFECDNCGTMLEEGDDYVTVLAKVAGNKLMFVNMRFCCTKCADEFASEHSLGGIIGVMPCMSDIDVKPDPETHNYIEWVYHGPDEQSDSCDNMMRQSWDNEEEDWDDGEELEEHDDWWEEDDGEWDSEEPY